MPRKKTADYIGRAELERQRERIEAGDFPFRLKMAGLKLGGLPITDYAPDFWLVQDADGKRVGYVTSAWWSPELEVNIALAHVPHALAEIGSRLQVELPDTYCENSGQAVAAEVCDIPFRPSVNPGAREVRREKEEA